MQEISVEEHRQKLLARLGSAREGYEQCVTDVTADVGNNGSEWSVADLLRHASAEAYRDRVNRLLEEDNPQLPGFDRERVWQRLAETCLARVDEALNLASALTPEQLARAGTRAGQPYGVVDALENWTSHFEEHLAQLRDEIRPREGLPEVSAGDS